MEGSREGRGPRGHDDEDLRAGRTSERPTGITTPVLFGIQALSTRLMYKVSAQCTLACVEACVVDEAHLPIQPHSIGMIRRIPSRHAVLANR